MAKKRTETIRSISFDDKEYKCGGCNWSASSFFFFSSEVEPKPDKDGDRLSHGVCANCFLDIIAGCKIEV